MPATHERLRDFVRALAAVFVPSLVFVASQSTIDAAPQKRRPNVEQSPANPSGIDQEAAEIQQLQDAVKRAERSRGRKSIDTADALNQLGRELQRLGRYAEAEPALRECLDILTAIHGPDNKTTALGMANLALLYDYTDEYLKAEPLYDRSLAILRRQLGPKHASVATVLNSMAGHYKSLGDTQRALEFAYEAYQIYKATYGDRSYEVAMVLNNLGSLYQDAERFDEADQCMRSSLQIRQQILKPNDPLIATTIENLAGLTFMRGQLDAAADLYRQALDRRTKKYGNDHPAVADSSYNLGVVLIDLERFDEAEPLLQQCQATWTRRAGEHMPKLANVLRALAQIEGHRQRWDEAAELIERARRINHRHITQILPGLPYVAQLQYLGEQDLDYDVGVSLGLDRRDDAEIVRRSANWVLNRKGLAQQALAENALLARDQSQPETAELTKRLQAVRARLATLVHGAPDKVDDAYRAEVARLNNLEFELSQQLARTLGSVPRKDPWMDVDEVRKAMPDGHVLAEITRFRRVDFAAGKQALPGHFAAWIIPPAGTGDIAVVDLGPADTIEAAVDELRKAIDETLAIRQKAAKEKTPEKYREVLAADMPANERRVRESSRALAKLVLDPLLAHGGSTKNWIISPEKSLWLVPWAALPLDDGRFVVEQLQITGVVSGRDLAIERPKYPTGAPLIVADPDFALKPADVHAQEHQVQGSRTRGNREPIKRLPGTAREAEGVRPLLEKYVGQSADIRLGGRAVERAVKSAQSPKVALLSTHGFFYAQDAKTKGTLFDNPLIRCGLLFAGADHAGDPAGAAVDDGWLTGWEAVGTDLRGTELVVLSACQTGLGDLRAGEGVGGLRQAFQLAGAESVVASLWSVPDQQSADLMINLFANLAAGHSKSAAMRNAQLKLIEDLRKSGASPHPFYWAAFTLTGLPSPEPSQPLPPVAAVQTDPAVTKKKTPARDDAEPAPVPDLPANAKTDNAKIDPRFVGTWEMKFQQAWTWVWTIDAKGTYELKTEGPGDPPGHSGTFEARDGNWKMKSTAGIPWTDGGKYEFPDRNTASMTGNLGPGNWKRREVAAAKKSDKPSTVWDAFGASNPNQPKDKSKSDPAGTVSKIVPLVAKARQLAKTWEPDAVLVGVFIKTGPDGRVDLKKLVRPPNFDGGFIAFQFYSPSNGGKITVGVEADGSVKQAGPVVQSVPGEQNLALPERFIDLDQVIAKARDAGIELPLPGSRSFVDARLTPVRGEAGKPNTATWTITAIDMSGTFPKGGDPIVLNATSGAETTVAELSGRKDLEALMESLSEGKEFPADTPRDYVFYRKEADAMAARWSKNLKLFQVDLMGEPQGKKFIARSAEFRYFQSSTETPGAWSVFKVVAFQVAGDKVLIRVDKLNEEYDGETIHPAPVPERFLSPPDAIAKLIESGAKIPTDRIYLELVQGGNLPENYHRGPQFFHRESGEVKFMEDVTEQIADQWIWRSFEEKTRREKANIFVFDRPYLDLVAIEAATGKRFKSAELAEPPSKTGVDPRLVGTWEGTLPDQKPPVTITMNISADGELATTVSVQGQKFDRPGKIAAADGKWTMHSSTDDSFSGTYKLVTPTRLEWTDQEQVTVTLTRVEKKPRAK